MAENLSIKIDDLDRSLIEMLKSDPDTPTRQLAQALQTTERTILNRQKKLFENDILYITYQWNIEQIGLRCNALVFIDVNNTDVKHAVDVLSNCEEFVVLCQMASPRGLFALVASNDPLHLHRVLSRTISRLPAISVDEVLLIAEVIRYPVNTAGSKAAVGEWPRLDTISPEHGVDETSFNIVSLYQSYPVISRRQVARKLGVSESVVKNKVKNLLDKELVSRATLVNNAVYGNHAVTMISISVHERDMADVCKVLLATAETEVLIKTVGPHNLFVVFSGDSIEIAAARFKAVISGTGVNMGYQIEPMAQEEKYLRSLNFSVVNTGRAKGPI